MQGDRVNKLAIKLSNSAPGTNAYLGSYKKARKIVKEKLSKSLCGKYKAMAKEWSEKKLPPTIKQRYMHGNYSSGLDWIHFFPLV
jgi:hypothetical protein